MNNESLEDDKQQTTKWITQESKLSFFEENYDVLSHGIYGAGVKIYIGSRDNKICRFCNKTESETTFKNISHAIPFFLGNNQLLINTECDICNKFFSENLETHLDKYTRPYRLAAQIRGRKGVPSFRSNDKKNRADFINSMEVKAVIDSGFATLDEENKKLHLNFAKEAYIPSAVYKALCKIAISTIDKESDVSDFQATINWLMNPDHNYSPMRPLKVATTFIPGPRPFDKVATFLLRKKSSSSLPYAVFVIAFGNFVYQLIIPALIDAANGNSSKITMPFFPTPFDTDWSFGEPSYGFLDFSSSELKTENAPIVFSYEKACLINSASSDNNMSFKPLEN